MFKSLIGVSRQDFLRTQVIPANDNDIHRTERCSFCWSPYDQEHPAARVLPCNHVFGGPCIGEMTTAPGGDLCPLCRVLLFRPPLKELLHSLVTDWFWQIHEQLWQVCDFWLELPSWLRFSCWTLAVYIEPDYWILRLFL